MAIGTEIIEQRDGLLVIGGLADDTSAVADALAALGWRRPQTSSRSSRPTEKGFFASAKMAALTRKMLRSAKLPAQGWQAADPDWLNTDAALALIKIGSALFSAAHNPGHVHISNDPRFGRLAGAWLAAMQASGDCPRLLFVNTAPQLFARAMNDAEGMETAPALALWLNGVLESEAASRGLVRAFTSRRALENDQAAECARLQDRLEITPNLPIETAMLATDAQRDRPAKLKIYPANAQLPAAVDSVFRIVERWAESGENPNDYPLLDRTRDLMHRLSASLSDAGDLLATVSLLDPSEASDAMKPESLQKMRKSDLVGLTHALQQAVALLKSEVAIDPVAFEASGGNFDNLREKLGARDLELATLGRLLMQAELRMEEAQANLTDQQNQITHLTQENAELAGDIAARVGEISGLEGQVETLSAEREKFERLALDSENQNTAQAAQIEELHALVARVERDRHAIANSTIWRATAPLRKVLSLFRRNKG